jgi:RNA polymerase sigma factor (sigma-70 family)
MNRPLARGSDLPAADRAEFEALVGPWVQEMYRVAAAIVGPQDARDVTQDALLDAWRGFARLRDQGRARPWLHAIVANRARKYLRAARSRPRLITVQVQGVMDAGGSAPDPAGQVAERDRLDRAFDHLSADQRICLALRYSLDLSVPEIAETLRLPEGTVKSRIHAALERLRTALMGVDR